MCGLGWLYCVVMRDVMHSVVRGVMRGVMRSAWVRDARCVLMRVFNDAEVNE